MIIKTVPMTFAISFGTFRYFVTNTAMAQVVTRAWVSVTKIERHFIFIFLQINSEILQVNNLIVAYWAVKGKFLGKKLFSCDSILNEGLVKGTKFTRPSCSSTTRSLFVLQEFSQMTQNIFVLQNFADSHPFRAGTGRSSGRYLDS